MAIQFVDFKQPDVCLAWYVCQWGQQGKLPFSFSALPVVQLLLHCSEPVASSKFQLLFQLLLGFQVV